MPVAPTLRAASKISLRPSSPTRDGCQSCLTHPIQGLDNYQQLMRTLTEGKGAIKVFCEIAPLD